MDDSLFHTLEQRIDALINRCKQLEAANRELEQNRNALLAERANFINQRKQIIQQMENLIGKLEITNQHEQAQESIEVM